MKSAVSRWLVAAFLAAAVVFAGAVALAVHTRNGDGTQRPRSAAYVAPSAPTPAPTAPTATVPPSAPAFPGTPAPAPTPTSPPPAYRLKIKGQYQWTDYYCEPASAAMTLSTFGIKVDQNRLARKMRTRPVKGTRGDRAQMVLDDYLLPHHFEVTIVGDVVGDPGALMAKVSYDVGVLRHAPMLQLWMEQLPWNRGRIPRRHVGHALVAYGYDTVRGTITVFDPWRPTGGTHTISARVLARTLQPHAGMHFIEPL